ncbi:MAG: hypothetical protein KF687_00265 [Cyclobacteriaceae bacterium]|nr:hypothetical protein [Cyclobacteriaceae bacterium]
MVCRSTIILLSFTILTRFVLFGQTAGQFEKNPKTKIPAGPELLANYEGLEFRFPSTLPMPMKFQIGEYKVMQPYSMMLDRNTSFVDKGQFKPGDAIISALLNRRENWADYTSRKGVSQGMQHYGISFLLSGYNNVIDAATEAYRFFVAETRTSGSSNNIQTDVSILTDTVYFGGRILIQSDSSLWNFELLYSRNTTESTLLGKLYSGEKRYELRDRVDFEGFVAPAANRLPFIFLFQENIAVGGMEFPGGYGSKKKIIYAPALPLADRLAFSAAGALFFSYWNTYENF